ncbi:MAG: M23 family metallopeptidase, partial [Gallionella sp.]
MTLLLRRLIFLTICILANTVHAGQQSYPFKLINQRDADRQVLMAQNKGPAPILMNLKLTAVDAIVEPSSSIVSVIKPNESISAATIRSKVPGQVYQVSSSYKYSIGDPDAVQGTDVTYRLPFPGGTSFTVGQVIGGKITTHTGPDSKCAIDFDVPIGTPVLAARKGIVVDIEQGNTLGGNDPRLKSNHVLVLHEDGTLGLYSHLAAYSHAVTFGQTVEAGMLIGYSGNVGYSTGPHLHFAVLTNTR